MADSASWRGPSILAVIFLFIAIAFGGFYFLSERINPDIALKRYQQAIERGSMDEALAHGKRALALFESNEADPAFLFDLRGKLARSYIEAGDFEGGAALLTTMLSSDSWRTLSPKKRLDLEMDLAKARILSGDIARGVPIFSSFLELAGNAATPLPYESASELQTLYAKAVYNAGDVFASAFRPALGSFSIEGTLPGDAASQLAIARQMVDLGAYYALYEESFPAAAGLLSAAYSTRQAHLPEHSRELTQIALILGPIYLRSKRYEDAEALYLRAFHAQERILGNESPDLSLYIKFLTTVYDAQGRKTESAALTQHMQSVFEDKFGRLRHTLVPTTQTQLLQPVSQIHYIPENYQPKDLVGASSYLIPVSARDEGGLLSDDVSLRLADDQNNIDSNANMPVRLAQVMNLCNTKSRDEILSLARGYKRQTSGEDKTTKPHPSGLSEHQLGLAVDLNINGRLMRQSDASWMCFRENAWRFGFILSWPQGNNASGKDNSFEPWHWRYIGPDTARLYREFGPSFQPQTFLANYGCYRSLALKKKEQSNLNANTTSQCSNFNTVNQTIESTPNAFTGQKTSERIVDPTTEKQKAYQQALRYGPTLIEGGRYEEAKALYINALRLSDAEHGGSSQQNALLVGMLADTYQRSQYPTLANSLSRHMTTILRNSYNQELTTQLTELPENDQRKAMNQFANITRPVSQYFRLHSEYQPEDLVPANDHGIPVSKDPSLDEMKLRFASTNNDTTLDQVNHDILRSSLPGLLSGLIDSCSAQIPDEAISLRSGYRAYTTQVSLYKRLRHRGTVTPPGMSEHQTGLAADIDVNGSFMSEDDIAFECFLENAHHYGFILSYPKGNKYLPSASDTFEPWHWRFVGQDAAKLYVEHGPKDKPQEFLAAIECYKEQANAREEYATNDNTDYCLYEDISGGSDIPDAQTFSEGENNPDHILATQESDEPAQNLNKVLRSGRNN